MQITPERITYLEDLAKLRLTDAERSAAETDLAKILDYMATLETLDTEGVDGLSHSRAGGNVLRQDIAVPAGVGRDALLENAPRSKNGYFVAPKTVE